MNVYAPASFEDMTAPPTDGRQFLAVLSNGKAALLHHPAATTGYYDWWECDGPYRVPVAETVCTSSREDFLFIVEWFDLSKLGMASQMVSCLTVKPLGAVKHSLEAV